MNSRETQQYWEGQYDALVHWASTLSKLADQQPTSKQLKQLAKAAQVKAVLIGHNKFTKDDHVQHAKQQTSIPGKSSEFPTDAGSSDE